VPEGICSNLTRVAVPRVGSDDPDYIAVQGLDSSGV